MHCVFKAPNVHFNRLTTCDQCFFFKSQVAKELTLYVELTMLVLKKKKERDFPVLWIFLGRGGSDLFVLLFQNIIFGH